MSLCREGPKVSLLFFADDSLLFCQANDNDYQTVLDILATCERASGQQINQGKTQLFLSTNTEQHIRNEISDLLRVSTASQYEKYLRLPSFVGWAKKQSFSYIRERVWSKIKGWKEKLVFYPKPGLKSSLNQSYKQCQHSPWGVSNSPRAFVKTLNLWFASFGGDKRGRLGKSTR